MPQPQGTFSASSEGGSNNQGQQAPAIDFGAFAQQSQTTQQGWTPQGTQGQQMAGRDYSRDPLGRFMSPRQMEHLAGSNNTMPGQPQAFMDPNLPPAQQQPPNNLVDFQQALAGNHHGLQQQGVAIQQNQAEMERLRGENDANKKMFEGMRQVFIPTATPDPQQAEAADAEKQLDYYLQEALVAEKEGRAIPLTTNLAVQFFQQKIAHSKEKADWNNNLSKMQNQINGLTDPNVMGDRSAYGNMDNFIINNVESIYGAGPEMSMQRKVQFDAIASMVGTEVKKIRETMPDVWDTIKRSPEKQKNLVAHFVNQNLPPVVRQKMETERLMSTPMGQGELMQAFQEAHQIQDPAVRADVQSKIRQEILSTKYQSSARLHG